MVADSEKLDAAEAATGRDELAELFDASVKFTSVLKQKGVSQATLMVRSEPSRDQLVCATCS